MAETLTSTVLPMGMAVAHADAKHHATQHQQGRDGIQRVRADRISRIEHGDIERAQVDTLRKYVEALGGTLHVEVEYGEERIQIA